MKKYFFLIVGNEGMKGEGGLGGEAAKNGDDYRLELHKLFFYGEVRINERKNNGMTRKGLRGRDGYNAEVNTNRLPAAEFDYLLRTKNNYQNCARDRLLDHIRGTKIKKFLDIVK